MYLQQRLSPVWKIICLHTQAAERMPQARTGARTAAITAQTLHAEVLTPVTMKGNLRSMAKFHRRFGGTCCFHLNCRRLRQAINRPPAPLPLSCLAYQPSTLNMEGIRASGTSVGSYRTTRRYIPQGNAMMLILCVEASRLSER
jgi:hypothetical protein